MKTERVMRDSNNTNRGDAQVRNEEAFVRGRHFGRGGKRAFTATRLGADKIVKRACKWHLRIRIGMGVPGSRNVAAD